MGRIRRSLVEKLVRAADSNYFELPKGWHVFSRYRTAELFLKHPAPPAVQYTDKQTYQDLAKAYPAVKLQPARINSTQPSLATRFVQQQHQIIEQYRIEHQRVLKKKKLQEQLAQATQQLQQRKDLQPEARQRLMQQHEQKYEQEVQQLEEVQQPEGLPALPQKLMQDIRDQAFAETESKLKRELDSAGRESTTGGYLEFIQEQETKALDAALKKLQDQQAAIS